MQNVKDDFASRSEEIDKYFDFVSIVLSPNSTLTLIDEDGYPSSRTIETELQKTLKAAGFLLLYNLVESTMSNAIEAIIDHLARQAICFDSLSREVKLVILRNAKKWEPEKLEPSLRNIAYDIINETFRKEELFSGNLDARKIREAISEYGITPRTTVNGDCLLTIKRKRNDLAHGITSFSDCGKDYNIEELVEFKDTAKFYLKDILSCVEDFLNNSGYVEKNDQSIED